jgi:hypothetical protein
MGFLDKAKQLAEQAQTKLDEVQTQFNEQQSGASAGGPPVEYDKHGRPVTPAEAPTPPHGDPVSPAPPAPPVPPAPTPDASAPPAPGPADAAEDRNHPSYAPPKLSSGDPLAG